MNGLLICAGESSVKNIGDYIQSLAQEQFFDKIDCYVEREKINTFSSPEKVNLIMNAWWMWHPENFPPSDDVNPLFLSFHVVPSIAKRMLTEKSVEYLKKYEPIGARDTGTQKLLESYGIKSYFSGCLTLTLGLKYKEERHDGPIIFVDPYYECGNDSSKKIVKILTACVSLAKNLRKVLLLRKKFACEFSMLSKVHMKWLGDMLCCASFYESYSNMFSDDVLLNAEFINHTVEQSLFKSEEEKLDYSRKLLHRYATAKLVVTSRIHCALPCLGIETPVIFVTSDSLENSDKVRSSGRFGGLIELFHTCRWTKNGVVSDSSYLNSITKEGKISLKTDIKNKDSYKQYAELMIEKINRFFHQ